VSAGDFPDKHRGIQTSQSQEGADRTRLPVRSTTPDPGDHPKEWHEETKQGRRDDLLLY